MKTFRFLGATFVAALLSFGFTSCNKDDAPISGVVDLPTYIDEVLSKSTTVELGKPGIEPIAVEVKEHPLIKSILLDSHEKATLMLHETKAFIAQENIIEATYNVDAATSIITINCDEFGTITLDMNSMAELVVDDEVYDIDATKVPADANTNEVSICRTWRNPTYTAGVFFDHVAIYGVSAEDKQGMDKIRTLADNVLDRLKSQNSNSFNPDEVKLLNSDIKSITFTAKKVFLHYTNGKVESSEWQWINKDKGELKTVIDGKDVFLNARFEKGTPNKAYFLIDGNFHVTGNLGSHSITGMLICVMNDAAPQK
ncbi:MAG: hypothetical protein KBT12_05855 [Bacteroidales bacterium]|nr:hypothetical protein [Candidatus Physcousia equi]